MLKFKIVSTENMVTYTDIIAAADMVQAQNAFKSLYPVCVIISIDFV